MDVATRCCWLWWLWLLLLWLWRALLKAPLARRVVASGYWLSVFWSASCVASGLGKLGARLL